MGEATIGRIGNTFLEEEVIPHLKKCIKILRVDEDRRDDILSLSSLKILKSDVNLSGSKNWKGYCYQIVKRVLIDESRKNSRQIEYISLTDGSGIDLEIESYYKERSLDNKQSILTILDSLNREEADMLIWYYVEDLTYKQIGELLNKSKDAIKSKMTRLLDRVSIYDKANRGIR